MYKAGDLVQLPDLGDPTSGQLSKLLRRVVRFAGVLTSSTPDHILDDQLIIVTTLEDKAASIVKALIDCHWTSTCIVTRAKFEGLCGGKSEASVMGTYMSGCGRAKLLSVQKTELIEGFKVSLSHDTVVNITSLDHDNLQMVWTAEKLHHQLDVIDRRYEMSRKSTLASLKEGNRRVALRHARALKFTSESREKLTLLVNRVDDVLHLIADAESTKKIAGKAMKENKLDIDELEESLRDLGEAANTQEQINDALGSSTYADKEDVEEELKELELEVKAESSVVKPPVCVENKTGSDETDELLAEAISSLKLGDGSASPPQQEHSKARLETA